MGSKVTVSVEDGASHSVSVSRNSTTTGQTYETRAIDAGKEHSFDLGDEQTVVIGQGPVTPEKASTEKVKKD